MKSLLFSILLLAAMGSAAAVDSPGADLQLLAQHKIHPTLDSTATYLRQLKPDPALQAKARMLVKQLSAPEFAVREAAVKELIELPLVPLDLLRQAEGSSDLKIAFRAKKILNHPRTKEKLRSARRRQDVVGAVLRTIRDTPIEHAAPVVLEVAPLLENWELTQDAAEAVAAVAASSDIALLRRSITSKNIATRVIAIHGLGHAASKSAQAELRALCDDNESQVALAAAHALAIQGDRATFAPLVRLLSDEDARIRSRSIQLLRALTNRRFGLNPFAEAEDQKAQLEQWKTWFSKGSHTDRLRLPLKLEPLIEDHDRGLLLHYTFKEDKGRTLKDSSGHERHGALHNAIETGRQDGREVLTVRGQGHHGDQGGHATIPFIDFASHDAFTLALWVYESGVSHPEGEAYITFGTDRGVGTEDSLGIAHFNSELWFRVGGGAVTVPFSNADRSRWVHYAMTFEDGRLRAYRDGTMIGETMARVSIVSKRAALGRHWWGDGIGTSTRFQGALDDVRLYDRAIPSPQIKILARPLK